MDAQLVTGYSEEGQLCSSCNKRYPEWSFRQDPYSCIGCLRFQEDHFYGQGLFSTKDLGSHRFRLFIPYDGGYTDEIVMEKLKTMFPQFIDGN